MGVLQHSLYCLALSDFSPLGVLPGDLTCWAKPQGQVPGPHAAVPLPRVSIKSFLLFIILVLDAVSSMTWHSV